MHASPSSISFLLLEFWPSQLNPSPTHRWQVCKRVFDLIGSSSSLQYHLELGRACMEDGPLSRMSTAERRKRLQAHIDAWRNLRWSSCVHLFDLPPNSVLMNVAPGGILTFISLSEYKIKFVHLLLLSTLQKTFSSYCKAKRKNFVENRVDLRLPYICRWRFHFLSLNSGEPHPLAAVFTPSDPPPSFRQSAHLQLLVAGDYVAALLLGYQLKICDWKTGQTVLVRPGTYSLTRRRVILTIAPVYHVLDYIKRGISSQEPYLGRLHSCRRTCRGRDPQLYGTCKCPGSGRVQPTSDTDDGDSAS